MGRSKTNAVYRFFKINEEDKSSTCDICGKTLKGNHGANLLKHLKHIHQSEHRLILDINNSSTEMNDSELSTFEQVLAECTNLVAIHGRPFSLIEDDAFQKLLKMIPNIKSSINSKKVRDNVTDVAAKKRYDIAKILNKKIICLKVDIASIGRRFFLGINCQYAEECQIILKNLSVTEIFERHTSEHLKDLLLLNLQRYRIDTQQIYCITTDNGANMLKMTKLVNEFQQANAMSEAGPSSAEGSVYEDFDLDEEAEYANDSEVENFTTRIMEELEAQFTDEESQHTIGLVRCAAHTLQLAMQDASNNVSTRALLAECREVVRRLRTPQYVRILKEHNKLIPKLDCATRWHSAVDMVESLLNLKEICALNDRLNIIVSSTPWNLLEDFVKSMAPAKLLTKKLQEEQLTLGNFYIEWTLCLFKLIKIDTELATSLHNKMKEREKILFDNDIFINAMFLDPRVNSTLTPEQIDRAKKNLIKLYFNYFIMECSSTSSADTPNKRNEGTDNIVNTAARSEIDEFLSSCYINRQNDMSVLIRKSDPLGDITNSLMQAFNVFLNEPLLKSTEDVLLYWERSKIKFPLLYKLATVVLAAPMTQVSVERLFSSLKFFVSNFRLSMTDNIIDDLLFLRSNHIFNRTT